jgi:putative glutathione S-transferase
MLGSGGAITPSNVMSRLALDASSQFHAVLGKHYGKDPSHRLQQKISRDRTSDYPAVPGRYLLLAADACPDSHQALMVLNMKGLNKIVTPVLALNRLGDNGWMFPEGSPLPFNSLNELYALSTEVSPDKPMIRTLPVLFDLETKVIINNCATDIIKMLTTEFDSTADCPCKGLDLYPESQRDLIDRKLQWFSESLSSSIYIAGFATSQDIYDKHVGGVFEVLGLLERRLEKQMFLCKEPHPTLADVALFSILLRWDLVYYSLFKCNLYRLTEVPALCDFVRSMYQCPGIRPTVNIDAIKVHYMTSFPSINPNMIIAKGPTLTYLEDTHRRELQRE